MPGTVTNEEAGSFEIRPIEVSVLAWFSAGGHVGIELTNVGFVSVYRACVPNWGVDIHYYAWWRAYSEGKRWTPSDS